MSEFLLHYLWQCQYFDKVGLSTTTGDPITILNTGLANQHAGPDFHNARIKIGDVMWVGTVEIHVHASEWDQHGHQRDEAYKNVILHVVWQNNKIVTRADQSIIPTLELKNRVDNSILLRYQRLVKSSHTIPCADVFSTVSSVDRIFALDRALSIRLENKAIAIEQLLEQNQNDWEETLYQQLAKNFGFLVNADPWQQLARQLPRRILQKHANKVEQLEALLFGVAGFLNHIDATDDYVQILLREYQILSSKFSLKPKELNRGQWKFLRLRPANFPTIRIAQFASLFAKHQHLFSKLLDTDTLSSLKEIFRVEQSVYWQNHYRIGENTTYKISGLGDQSIENIIINTVVTMPMRAKRMIIVG
jgi:hypothetical protein